MFLSSTVCRSHFSSLLNKLSCPASKISASIYRQSPIRSLSIEKLSSKSSELRVNQVFQKSFNNNIIIRNNLQQIRSKHQSTRAKRTTSKVKLTPLPDKFNMVWPKITLFGDSITRRSIDPDHGCWGSMLAYKFGEYFDVDVRGFEGYNSRWALELVEKLFPKSYLEKVETFVIFFGHNDSWDKQMPMHVPVEEYEENIRKMIKYLNENGVESRKIVLITPSWFHYEAANKYFSELVKVDNLKLEKTLEDARKYSEAILRVAKDNNAEVVNFFETSLKAEPLEAMFCDGVHFSKHGAEMLFKQLSPVVEKIIAATFKKPIGDLWHTLPVFEIPVVKERMGSLVNKANE